MLTDIEAREALHVLVLEKLAEEVRSDLFVVKGGMNVRLFFGSVRYSEDMDLDVEAAGRACVVRSIGKTLSSPWLQARLRAVGLTGVEYSGRPSKNTDTTYRVKLKVVNSAGIGFPTKIEASFRGRPADEAAVCEEADGRVVRKYMPPMEGRLVIPHYPVNAAARQKMRALADRRTPEARDVFDLYVLARGTRASLDLPFLRRGLTAGQLASARQRVWVLDYRAYLENVVEFLSVEDRREFDSQALWEERQLFAVELIDAVGGLPEPPELRIGG
jgi:predicted nucleotidyltransferase component of viral defense system